MPITWWIRWTVWIYTVCVSCESLFVDAHTHTHSHKHTHMHTHTRTRTRAHARTHTHVQAHTHTHTHNPLIHTNTNAVSLCYALHLSMSFPLWFLFTNSTRSPIMCHTHTPLNSFLLLPSPPPPPPPPPPTHILGGLYVIVDSTNKQVSSWRACLHLSVCTHARVWLVVSASVPLEHAIIRCVETRVSRTR